MKLGKTKPANQGIKNVTRPIQVLLPMRAISGTILSEASAVFAKQYTLWLWLDFGVSMAPEPTGFLRGLRCGVAEAKTEDAGDSLRVLSRKPHRQGAPIAVTCDKYAVPFLHGKAKTPLAQNVPEHACSLC